MRTDKNTAISLRKIGKTYKEIVNELGVSKGTLSAWFKDKEWSGAVLRKNTSINVRTGKERMLKMNTQRAINLKNHYTEGQLWAKEVFPKYSEDPLFVSALMLYMGEGDKSLENHMVRITNIDYRVLKIFTLFLLKYCGVEHDRLRAWILLYPDLDAGVCRKHWSRSLGIPEGQFHKSQVITGKGTRKKLHYGVGTIIIGDKLLKVKILHWIDLLSEHIIENAGMV